MHCLGFKMLPVPCGQTATGTVPCNFRNFPFLTASCKISPSARTASAANRVCKDERTPTASLQKLPRYSVSFCIKLCTIFDV